MHIHIAADHAGFELKERLKEVLMTEGYEVTDYGSTHLDPEDDYPDIILPCAQAVAAERGSFGIVIGGSGQGEAMVANRVPGVRAAVYYGPAGDEQVDAGGVSLDLIASVRAHNDANILSLGARFLSPQQALVAVEAFIHTPFSSEERHIRRVEKIV